MYEKSNGTMSFLASSSAGSLTQILELVFHKVAKLIGYMLTSAGNNV